MDFPTTRTPLAENELYYRIHGEEIGGKTPIVLLHGLMGFAANWGKIWPELSKDQQVLVLDQCGHGRSAHRETGYAPGDYASDLNALLERLGWTQVHIVGHSMGGRVALAFCSNFPQKTLSVTLEDSGVEARPDRLLWIKALLDAIPTPFINQSEAKSFFAQNYGTSMLGTFLYANLKERDDGSWDWRFYRNGMIETIRTGRCLDASQAFTNLKIPNLIVRGGKSEEFSQDEFERMIAMNANSQGAIIKDAGHFVHAEKPAEFTQALHNFLSRIS